MQLNDSLASMSARETEFLNVTSQNVAARAAAAWTSTLLSQRPWTTALCLQNCSIDTHRQRLNMPGLNLALAKNKNRDGAEPAKETSRVAMTNNDTLVDDGYSFLGNDYGAEIENENNENPKGEGKGLWAGKFKKKAAEKVCTKKERGRPLRPL